MIEFLNIFDNWEEKLGDDPIFKTLERVRSKLLNKILDLGSLSDVTICLQC